MRCVALFYLLLLKIGGKNMEPTKELPNSYNKRTHDMPIFNRISVENHEIILHPCLNIYVVENYFYKVIERMVLSCYDMCGIYLYMKRLYDLPVEKLTKYSLSSYIYILPVLAIIHRKVSRYDIEVQNAYYIKNTSMVANDLLIMEAHCVTDIDLFIDDTEYTMTENIVGKELKLLYRCF
jgi:hypothetical protein